MDLLLSIFKENRVHTWCLGFFPSSSLFIPQLLLSSPATPYRPVLWTMFGSYLIWPFWGVLVCQRTFSSDSLLVSLDCPPSWPPLSPSVLNSSSLWAQPCSLLLLQSLGYSVLTWLQAPKNHESVLLAWLAQMCFIQLSDPTLATYPRVFSLPTMTVLL